MKSKLILLRHGESEWNKENKFTGWTDIDLTNNGKNEAKNAGILAAQILGSADKNIQQTIVEYKETLKSKVMDSAKNIN